MNMKLSVIIPSHNRKDILSKCLESLANQIVSAEYEVLVIDDGSTDGTSDFMDDYAKDFPVPLKQYRLPGNGPAAARNVGIKNAIGDILLFIGDDIIAGTPHFLEHHLGWHQERFPSLEIAVLGYTTWSPEIEITPYMRWLENGGPQFAYHTMENGGFAHFFRFYTCNISLKKAFIKDDLFDERFLYAAMEDSELGYRLQKRGMKIIFNKQALGHHYHEITLEEYCKRGFIAGRADVIFMNIHPEIVDIRSKPTWKQHVKKVIFTTMTISMWIRIAKYFERHFIMHRLYKGIYEYYFRKGLRYMR